LTLLVEEQALAPVQVAAVLALVVVQVAAVVVALVAQVAPAAALDAQAVAQFSPACRAGTSAKAVMVSERMSFFIG
jgi:hypothetical protein